MLRYVTKARYLGGHRVRLCFDDGVVGDVDLGPFLNGPVFQPLKDPTYFAGFGVDHTLVWPNHADFAPEFLREKIVPATDDTEPVGTQNGGCWRDTPPVLDPGRFEVSRFLGVTVSMGIPWLPLSRVLVESEAHSAQVEIETGARFGKLLRRSIPIFEQWRLARIEDLRNNVARLERGEPALPIEPLE
jgi:hypothetical protein